MWFFFMVVYIPGNPEHQEKLKLIHEKFKEEVNQHLQDCSNTLEGLEADKIEFKGTFEKQSMELSLS